jgi:hypothetical protein
MLCHTVNKFEDALRKQHPFVSSRVTVMNEAGVLLHYFPSNVPSSNLEVRLYEVISFIHLSRRIYWILGVSETATL